MICGVISKDSMGNVHRYVTVNQNVLFPYDSWKVMKHTIDPDDWCNWGYEGSGPAQLSLAILLRFCREGEAVRFHQQFKRDIIAKLPANKDFQLSNQRIHMWLDVQRKFI